MKVNPFAEEAPQLVRARFYRYRFTDAETRRTTEAWWERELLGEYLPAVSLEALERI